MCFFFFFSSDNLAWYYISAVSGIVFGVIIWHGILFLQSPCVLVLFACVCVGRAAGHLRLISL